MYAYMHAYAFGRPPIYYEFIVVNWNGVSTYVCIWVGVPIPTYESQVTWHSCLKNVYSTF